MKAEKRSAGVLTEDEDSDVRFSLVCDPFRKVSMSGCMSKDAMSRMRGAKTLSNVKTVLVQRDSPGRCS